MTVIVNGIEKELCAMGKNGIEWTDSLLHEYEVDPDNMTEGDFIWWKEVITNMNRVYELEEELDSETREEYYAEFFAADLDTETENRLAWLEAHI